MQLLYSAFPSPTQLPRKYTPAYNTGLKAPRVIQVQLSSLPGISVYCQVLIYGCVNYVKHWGLDA